MNTEVRKLLRTLRRMGWTHTVTGTGHHKATHPSGAVVVFANSPSDRRWLRNVWAVIKRVERKEKL